MIRNVSFDSVELGLGAMVELLVVGIWEGLVEGGVEGAVEGAIVCCVGTWDGVWDGDVLGSGIDMSVIVMYCHLSVHILIPVAPPKTYNLLSIIIDADESNP